jgi:heme/copper-type cytochrome/quinol oxidase subunit 2
LCGIGHTTMRARVVVESQADYDAWVKKQTAKVPELLLTTDQFKQEQLKKEEQSGGIEGSGVIEQ